MQRHGETANSVALGRRRAQTSDLEHARPGPSGMSGADVELLQESFEKVAPIATVVADLFYERLFALLPESRVMFPDDLRAQKRKLMDALGLIVRDLPGSENLRFVLEMLGRRHVAYGVTAHHYDVAGAALLHALEQGLGNTWSEPLKRAWTQAYRQVADTMLSADDERAAKAPQVS